MHPNTIALNAKIDGQGTPILLIHGFPDTRKVWREMVPLFVKSNYKVIAPDLRGYGESSLQQHQSEYKVKLIVADVIRLLDDNGITEPVHVMGHDWGAVIAWCVALWHPKRVKKLIPVSVGHPRTYAFAGWKQKVKGLYVFGFQLKGIAENRLSKNDYQGLRKWGQQHPHIDEVVADMSREGRLTAGLNYYRANLLDFFTIKWPKCEVPALGIWSTEDSFLTKTQMTDSQKQMNADWEYVQFDNCGHWIPLEQPQELFKCVDDWIKA